MDPFEQPPSPAKNFIGGGGCGCGCLGLIIMLIASVFMGAMYLGYLATESAGSVWITGAIGLTSGALLLVMGVVMWIVSVVLD